jgi:uncharacterized membrane protein HdeD (DUF308 family)
MVQTMSLSDASDALRLAMRETVRRHAILYMMQGVLMVVGGVVAVLYPLFTTVALAIFVGWTLIIMGIVQAIGLIGATKVPHFWLQLISVVLALVIGWLFIRNPAQGVETLALLMIVFLMIEGIAKIVLALTIRPLPRWGWMLGSGLIGVLLSAWLLANPNVSIVILGLFFGITLILEGAALAVLAWEARRA